MPTIASGSYTFEDTPTVNGLAVLLNGGGTGTITSGTLAARPAASAAGNLYVDTTNNLLWGDSGAAWVQVSTGRVLQVVSGSIPASSGTATIPLDGTAPLVTEGWQMWTKSFTPLITTSRIIIQFSITTSHSVGTGTNICSVFAGNTNIGAAAARTDSVALTASSISLSVVYAPGSTAAITFSARLGNPTVGTSYCNTVGTTNTLGGTLVSEYTITEVQ